MYFNHNKHILIEDPQKKCIRKGTKSIEESTHLCCEVDTWQHLHIQEKRDPKQKQKRDIIINMAS